MLFKVMIDNLQVWKYLQTSTAELKSQRSVRNGKLF